MLAGLYLPPFPAWCGHKSPSQQCSDDPPRSGDTSDRAVGSLHKSASAVHRRPGDARSTHDLRSVCVALPLLPAVPVPSSAVGSCASLRGNATLGPCNAWRTNWQLTESEKDMSLEPSSDVVDVVDVVEVDIYPVSAELGWPASPSDLGKGTRCIWVAETAQWMNHTSRQT